MGEHVRKIIGFHGTRREFADSILQSERFKISKDDEEWLGPGVYFFENDIKQAYYYCIKAKKFKSWAILRSDIQANIIMDLTDLETLERFEEVAEAIKNRYYKRSDGKPRKLLNSVVLNIIYKAEEYDLVRAVFPVPSTRCIPRTNIMPMQVQLCVRNLQCIKTITEVEYDEQKRVL
ncbi:hypothetical protein KQI42_07130 [Tissierella sp. MSJ-40]|uniref:DUF3990 domain-containing protein n=1 Tax=Tissierella simiarum TaxID=2841534 RepID=A0ABS6E4E0_9FIRM|nr:hypothetical protein [Tissierella simiarum]MBU5437774.1 hypothetical protein [Tissierella simiarum]